MALYAFFHNELASSVTSVFNGFEVMNQMAEPVFLSWPKQIQHKLLI